MLIGLFRILSRSAIMFLISPVQLSMSVFMSSSNFDLSFSFCKELTIFLAAPLVTFIFSSFSSVKSIISIYHLHDQVCVFVQSQRFQPIRDTLHPPLWTGRGFWKILRITFLFAYSRILDFYVSFGKRNESGWLHWNRRSIDSLFLIAISSVSPVTCISRTSQNLLTSANFFCQLIMTVKNDSLQMKEQTTFFQDLLKTNGQTGLNSQRIVRFSPMKICDRAPVHVNLIFLKWLAGQTHLSSGLDDLVLKTLTGRIQN